MKSVRNRVQAAKDEGESWKRLSRVEVKTLLLTCVEEKKNIMIFAVAKRISINMPERSFEKRGRSLRNRKKQNKKMCVFRRRCGCIL